MLVQIAVGTMFGVLGAALILFLIYRLRQYKATPEDWRLLKRYSVVIVSLAVVLPILWIAFPIIQKEITNAQRRSAAIERAELDRSHCKAQMDKIIERAAAPLTGPIGPMGLNRIRRDYETRRIGKFGDSTQYRSPHGWLSHCRNLGAMTLAEYVQAIKLQRRNQELYDKPELDKRKALNEEMDEVSKRLLKLP